MKLSRVSPGLAARPPWKPVSRPAASRVTVKTGCATSRTSTPCAGKLAHDGIEQKRHVVVGDLDHRDVLEPLAVWHLGDGDAQLGRAGRTFGKVRPRPLGQRRNLAAVVENQVLGRHAVE